ncbi:MAG: hypothetical protein IJX55_06005, partial [Clostridia bacterium]|nr:hypothetical protein [Clostridia bacterium]
TIFQTTGYEAICKIINFFSKGEIRYYDKKDIYNHILKVSVCYCNDGRKDIFDIICGALESSAKKYCRDFEDICFEFFSETGTVRDALERLELFYRNNGNDYVILFLIENLLRKAGYSELQALYAEDKSRYSALMIAITNSMDVANPAYRENTELLKADGITLPPPRVRIDYEAERKKGEAIYFDSLFDKNEYAQLLQEMLEFIKKPEITFDKFDGCFSWSDFGGCAREQALFNVARDISHFEAGNKKVKDFLSLLRDWEEYAIFKTYRVLETTDIEPSESQREYIENYFRREIGSIDFENAIKEEDGSISYSQHLAVTVFLSEKLNIAYDKEIYLKMLSLPTFVFDRGNGDNESFSEYVTSHLTEIEIKNRVFKNMCERKLCNYSARTHLRYCKENHLAGVAEYVEFICESKAYDEWTKRRALEYLLEMKGVDYVYDKYLYIEDNSLFEDIVELTWQKKSEKLKSRLEEKSRDAKDGTKYLKILIAMRSKYALQRYYEIAKEKNAIPDYSKADGYMPLTESIALADELELLPELEKLQKLLFTEGFKDKDAFGLRNALHKAFQNMAGKHYDEVFAYFETCLQNSELTMEEQSFCNSILQDISAANNLSEDKPWKIREVIMFFRAAE